MLLIWSINGGNGIYQKEKKYDLTEYLDRLKQRFAWDNDAYDISKEEIPHTGISADFPGIALDHNDDVEPISELYEETAEEQVRRMSQTTGVPAHCAGTTKTDLAPDSGTSR